MLCANCISSLSKDYNGVIQKGPDLICCHLQRKTDTIILFKNNETRRLKLLNIVLSAKVDNTVKLFKNYVT